MDRYRTVKPCLIAWYRGPIGIIAYGIKGDRREILGRSMQAWKKLSAQVATEK
jgi:hypothetical protein